MNKIIYIVLIIALVGCKAAKPKVVTTKVAKPVRKEVYKPKSEEVKIDNTTKPQTEILEATSKIKVTTEVVLTYISQFKVVAQDNMKKHGIPASIILAQGILESGAGTGLLCRLANNHFGIKCHKEWTGEYVRYDDDAAQECFRKYEEPGQSYRDHSLFLTSRPWYAPLFKLPKDDYKAWARGLKKSGYATDPKYPDKLIGIIERYQLQQYDAQVLGIKYEPEVKSITQTPIVSETKPAVVNDNSYMVAQGDTLYSISKKFNTTVEEIKRKNNIIENAISIGQVIMVK